MDSASTGDDRLREIVDRLLASPVASARDRLLLEEAKALLAPPAHPTITIRHDPRTVPDPTITSLRMPGGDR
jgi:hypothetical protein